MKHKDIVEKMSLKQKADFVSGYDYWHLEEAEELGLPKIMITDGPHGLRKQTQTERVLDLEIPILQPVCPLLQHQPVPGMKNF